MSSEIFSHLKEKGQVAVNAFKRTKKVDVSELTANIERYKGRRVIVVGNAKHAEDRAPRPKPLPSSHDYIPPLREETATLHTLFAPEQGGQGVRASIIFRETTDNIEGEKRLPLPRHEGWVAVQGRVKTEKVTKDLDAALGTDKVSSLGEVTVSRPYIKATDVVSIEGLH